MGHKVPNSNTWTSQCKIFIKVEGHDKKVVNSKQDIDCFLQNEKSTSPHEITAPQKNRSPAPPPGFDPNLSTVGYSHNTDGFYSQSYNTGYGRGAPNPRSYYDKRKKHP